MGDSDEEYERRKGRDKFRRERSDYQERREDRGRRDDWQERDRSSRRDYRDGYDPRSRRDRYSPPRHDMSPPAKRVRREWIPRDDRGYGNYDGGYPGGGSVGHRGWGGGEMGGMTGQHGYASHQGPQRAEMEPGLTQPPMMTFKQFLTSQDDGIDDQEAVKKYKEYKLEFKRQQINDFFLNHKEEEWFKSKYHPEDCGKRRSDQLTSLRRRLDVYLELLEKGWIDAVSIDVEKSDQIVRLLDAVVIKLEGGTDFDLKSLDESFEEDKPKDPEVAAPVKEEVKKEEKEVDDDDGEVDDKEGKLSLEIPISEEQKELQQKPKEFLRHRKEEDDQKRKRPRDYDYDENEESSAESDSESEAVPPEDDGDSGVNADEPAEEKQKKKKKRKTKDSESRSEHDDSLDKEDDDDGNQEHKEEKVHTKGDSGSGDEKSNSMNLEKDGGGENSNKESKEDDNSPPKPRSFHKTCSIFLRNLAPTITKQEVEAMCRRYPGFLRVAIADPQPERRFFRRGWVTFERSVNIKEICWNLNNIRLRDCELGAIVNRDLSRRIRSINGIASDKQVVRSDIKLAARIIQNLDNQKRLWSSEEQEIDQNYQSYGLASKNPLLKNITDYLIEEASAEEEELLGMASQDDNKEREEVGSTLERDETLIKVLDRLLVYLRVVHSVDYYNHSEYPNEDEMPNRCGIMHARGSPPSSKVTQQEINEYINNFEMKSAHFLQPQAKVTDDEAEKLGRKDPDAEVEKFVQANTQELAKDKWLCPLSGKKFKGPEFVRKHIFNKHAEKVEEVRREVEYFNNYLLDPKRPQLPEHPSNRTNMGGGAGAGGGGIRDGYGGMAPYHSGPGFPPPFGGFSGHRGGMGGPGFQGYPGSGYGGRNNFPEMYNRSGGGGFGRRNFGRNPRFDSRKLISYRDLDAPSEQDAI